MAYSDQVAAVDAACLRAFGRDVIYRPSGGGQAAIRAIFQEAREPEDASPGTYGVMFIRRADLGADPQRGDEAEIDGAHYTVWDIEADPEGGAVLRMRRAD